MVSVISGYVHDKLIKIIITATTQLIAPCSRDRQKSAADLIQKQAKHYIISKTKGLRTINYAYLMSLCIINALMYYS